MFLSCALALTPWPVTHYSQALLQHAFQWPRDGGHDDGAHPPIHPVKSGEDLHGDEGRVYEYVARRFLACCSRDALGHETVVHADVAGERFTASGLMILERNYLNVFTYDRARQRQAIASLTLGPLAHRASTTGPVLASLQEGHLIGLMDSHGIGTDATIAEHIKKVLERQYTEKMNDFFYPTAVGKVLLAGYKRMGFDLGSTLPRVCPALVSQHPTSIYASGFIVLPIKPLQENLTLKFLRQVETGPESPVSIRSNREISKRQCVANSVDMMKKLFIKVNQMLRSQPPGPVSVASKNVEALRAAAQAEFQQTDTSRWAVRPLSDGSSLKCGKCRSLLTLRVAPQDQRGQGGGGKGGDGGRGGGGGKGWRGGGGGGGGGGGDGGWRELRVLHCGKCSDDHWLPAAGELSKQGQVCPLCGFEALTVTSRANGSALPDGMSAPSGELRCFQCAAAAICPLAGGSSSLPVRRCPRCNTGQVQLRQRKSSAGLQGAFFSCSLNTKERKQCDFLVWLPQVQPYCDQN
ncbi:MAG: hypothetical protein SGPRY_002146 [Prymnesium sp.]